MKLSKTLFSAGLSVLLVAGSISDPAAAEQAEPGWGFVDISDDSTEGRGIDAGDPGESITFVNPTEFELYCFVFGGPSHLVKPAYDVWLQNGSSREDAEAEVDRVRSRLRRAVADQVGGMTNGSQDYIAPGEEIEFDLSFGMKPGWGVMLTCSPTKSAIGTVLVGYGEVQKDYSLKSTVPNVDRKFPTPPTTPAETITVTAPAETATVTAPVKTTTVTAPAETATVTAPAETTTVTAPAETTTVTAPAETTTVTAPAETATVTAPAETATVTAPAETVRETVTTTAAVTASGGDGSSSGSAIGWIIGLLLAFGLGGAAGFAAQNLPNLPF